ncbi:MAG: carbon-nitrogen hydrolase [Streptosporangiales bacterium]|nr:carbon-nitrogen hydrolase [Streptosporangiales bacterium]
MSAALDGSASEGSGGVLRVAAWQCAPAVSDTGGNLRRLSDAAAGAAARGAAVLVTPEMLTSGYGLDPAGARLHAARAADVEAQVADIAVRHGIAVAWGHPVPAPVPGGVYNAVTLTGADGVRLGRHLKTHLFGDLDRELFVPSPDPPETFEFRNIRIGMLVCYDVEFPEAVRRLAVGGARAVLVPTANMRGFEEVPELLVRARACENGCGVVYANYCGADPVFTYGGLSVICGPGGEVLASAGPDDEELIIADVPLAARGTYLADRRPGLY